MIDGSLYEDDAEDNNVYSEADIVIGGMDEPITLEELLTAGIIVTATVLTGGEIGILAAGIEQFGYF